MSGGIDVNNIDRSRAALRRRIEQLNRQNARTVAELDQILKEQVALGTQLMREDIVHAVLECFSNLVLRTPVDTGRLRAGWQFTGNISDVEFVPGKTDAEIQRALETAVRDSVISDTDALYVFNNVEYLLALNAGWSKSQAGNFIDLFLLELKNALQEAANGRSG